MPGVGPKMRSSEGLIEIISARSPKVNIDCVASKRTSKHDRLVVMSGPRCARLCRSPRTQFNVIEDSGHDRECQPRHGKGPSDPQRLGVLPRPQTTYPRAFDGSASTRRADAAIQWVSYCAWRAKARRWRADSDLRTAAIVAMSGSGPALRSA